MAIPPQPQPTSTTTTTPAPLTFPAHTFAKLSPSKFLTAHLLSPTAHRPSGRLPSHSRPPTCRTGSLTHAHGSAVVRCGDTAVVCGIRGEVLRVDDVPDWGMIGRERGRGDDGDGSAEGEDEEERERKRRKSDTESISQLNLLVPNLELATGCSPAHLPGGPPSLLAQTLTQRILTLLHTSQLLDISDLQIWSQPPSISTQQTRSTEVEEDEKIQPAKPEIKAFWTLYVDILFLSLSGNPFDAAWFAVLAALGDVRLPRAWWDGDAESVICSPLVDEATRLRLWDIPVALSFGVLHADGEGRREIGKEKEKKWILVDMDGFEEGLCKETVTVVVGGKDRIIRIEKSGGGGAGLKEMRGLVQLAGERREEWIGVLGMR